MMAHTLYHFLVCEECGRKLQLPVSTLEKLAGHPSIRATEKFSVAVSCHGCKQIKVYGLTGNTRLEPVTVFREFLELLSCDEGNCHTPLKVIAIRSADMSDEEYATDLGTNFAAPMDTRSQNVRINRGFSATHHLS
jgi:hypothetical protein